MATRRAARASRPPAASCPRGIRGKRRRRWRCRRSLSAMPNLAIAASVSPPPAMENAFESAMARAIACVPPANWSYSNTPTGPFQTMVPALRDACAASTRGRLRADVEYHVVGPDLGRRQRGFARASAETSLGHDHVDRQRHLRAARLHQVDDRLRLVHQRGLGQRFADAQSRSEHERVGDAAAHDQLVHFRGERFQDGELGRNLGAGDDRDQRPRGMVERLAQRVELGRHQRPGAGDGGELAQCRGWSPRRGARCRTRRSRRYRTAPPSCGRALRRSSSRPC